MRTRLELEDWELARLAGRWQDEIYDRTTGRFSRDNPLGDPTDITVLEKGLKILYSHKKVTTP